MVISAHGIAMVIFTHNALMVIVSDDVVTHNVVISVRIVPFSLIIFLSSLRDGEIDGRTVGFVDAVFPQIETKELPQGSRFDDVESHFAAKRRRTPMLGTANRVRHQAWQR